MATRMRSKVKEQYWRRQGMGWQLSGLGIRAYCQKHQLSEANFHAWRRELARRDQLTTPASTTTSPSSVSHCNQTCSTDSKLSLLRGENVLKRASFGEFDQDATSLGLDRDSNIVAHLFDERNPAVLKLIEDVIKRVKACGRKIGICE